MGGLLLGVIGFIVTDVEARGRGGGGGRGGFSRSGPAAGGSFRGSRGSYGGHASRPSTRPAGGSFERPSTRPAERPRQPERPSTRPEQRPSTRPEQRPGEGDPGDRQQDRQDWRDDAREDRQDYRDAARYQRAEYAEDLYTYDEWYEDRQSWAVGAALTAATFRSLSCTPTTVVVGSTTYYQCGSSWYNRAYQGGQVTYIVVNPPPEG
jgi:hypothetical protein